MRLEVGLCISEEGKMEAMLCDSSVHSGHKAPKHAQAEAPGIATLFKNLPE